MQAFPTPPGIRLDALLATVLLLGASSLCGADDGNAWQRLVAPAQATVLHAGGAVRFQMPADWVAEEVPAGRQLRLVVGPPSSQPGRAQIWLALRYREAGFPARAEPEFLQWAVQRFRHHQGSRASILTADAWHDRDGQWARVEFTTATSSPSVSGNESRTPAHIEGVYLVRQVDWAQLEIVATKPSRGGGDEETWRGLDGLLDSLTLVAPVRRQLQAPDHVQSAGEILGAWKASGSLLRLQPQGTIEIVTDQPFRVADGRGDGPATSRTLVGKFEAQQDLLFTEWADGSKLNYRWRLHEGDLLLTDSEGRTAKLWPILE